MSEKLLLPIAAELRGKRRWIVSPDGALAMLPFETLELDGKTVIVNHDLSYIQSLSMLALLVQRDADYRSIEGRKTLFAMGDAQYEAAADGGARGARRAQRGAAVDIGAFLRGNAGDKRGIQRAFDLLELGWPDLPGSGNEGSTWSLAHSPASRSPCSSRRRPTRPSCSSSMPRASSPPIATCCSRPMAISAPADPALSAIVLSQRDKATGTDGYVTASEWPAYELRSDLIVLSACETGLARWSRARA